MTKRKIVNAVRSNLAEILEEQVQILKDTSSVRQFDKTECILLKLCMDLVDKKLDNELEGIVITSRMIQSDEEKQTLLQLAMKN